MSPSTTWRPQLTRQESLRGWVFFALYVLLFPRLLGFLQRILGDKWPFPPAETALLYYFIAIGLLFAIFWGFLRHGLALFLDHLDKQLFGILSGLLVGGGLFGLLHKLPIYDPWGDLYRAEFAYAPQATALLVVVLMPLVEEVFFRGLLFGSLRKKSRRLAYVVTVLAFCFFSVQGYAFTPGATDLSYLWLMIPYLPLSLGLTWCYDVSGAIWSPVLLHMLVRCFQLFFALNH